MSKEESKESEEKLIDKDDVFVIDDDCDEDVPGDFFDDFLKDDFMAGLDIVDDDQWENSSDTNKVEKSGSNQEKEKSVRKSDTQKEEKGSKRKRSTTSKKSDDRKERGKAINADEFDIRRDPNKTRRDIQRDKVKCEKDKEKKMISEKLKLVETGLVPPGMEMEVDISEISKEGNAKKKVDSRKETPTKNKIHSVSPLRHTRRNSRNRLVSPTIRNRFSPLRSPRSPLRRKSRERSSRDRDRISRDQISRERRSRERSIERTLRSIRRSRSKSLHRDRRTRYSPEYSRRRRRTRSRSRDRARDKKKENKKSFLQEIVEKLRESRPSSGMMPPNQYIHPPPPYMHPGPSLMPPGPPPIQTGPPPIQPGSVLPPVHNMQQPPPDLQSIIPPGVPVHTGTIQPVPVPAPSFPIAPTQQIPLQMHVSAKNQYDPYDQSFFIGTPQQPSPAQNSESYNNVEDGRKINSESTNGSQRVHNPQLQVGKLFHDKKITLSEFLAISAKPEVYSATPIQLKDKVKVLSRCHDAIKILEAEEKKFQGPFQLRRTLKPQSDAKFKSPLLKLAEAKISFTEIPTKENNKSAFNKQLNNLLHGIGLLDEVVELDDDIDPVISNVTKSASPPPPPHISRQRKSRTEDIPVRIYNDHRLAKMVQTEPMPKCLDCEKRRKIGYKTSGCQTGELMTYSVSTQVSEDDLINKIPKNQSLASLTPAQLLAQNAASSSSSKRFSEDDFDIYPSKSSFGRGGLDYARAADGYGNLSGNIPRYDRDRDEIQNNLMYPGARGRGPNNFDIGPRYSYY